MRTKIIILIALILIGGMNLYAQNGKTLIAYFSWSGNTQHVAEYIAGQTGGTLFRIDPVKPYPTDYKPCTEVAKKEKEQNVWGIERSGFFNGREKWVKGFESQMI